MILTPEQLQPLTGSDFAFEVAEGAPVTLRLDSVNEARSDQGFRQFSLYFSGPLDAPLMQGTYLIRHPVLGEGPLFLVPTGRDAEQMCYEAACSCQG
ncbi:DUF6916 family protein [Isoalcanivorax indicus]|uniref:DUF6916 family protein n=1 Tax=Isoalcanivorax indicus TaxID=2202653 RepID=UPI000DBA1E0E|nr:hypothetical protein [Isoalcanivorax indicus]